MTKTNTTPEPEVPSKASMKFIAIESALIAQEQECLIRFAEKMDATSDFDVEECIDALHDLGRLLTARDALEKANDWYNSEYLQKSVDV